MAGTHPSRTTRKSSSYKNPKTGGLVFQPETPTTVYKSNDRASGALTIQKQAGAKAGLGGLVGDDPTLQGTPESNAVNPELDRTLTEPAVEGVIPRARMQIYEAVERLRAATDEDRFIGELDKIQEETDVEIGLGRNVEMLAAISKELGYYKLADSIKEI